MRIGLDFGTSNSSVAIFDGKQVRFLPIDRSGRDPSILRSFLYITREGERVIGQEAIDFYLEQNIGREIVLTRKSLGQITQAFAEVGTVTIDVHAMVDEDMPGRLFQSLKSSMKYKDHKGTNVFGKIYQVEDLVAMILKEMKQRAERILKKKISSAVIGRPVKFSESPQEDELAQARLRRACEKAGFQEVSFLFEPVAAALYYESIIETPEHLLVFDFGGGTLDITIMNVGTKEGSKILATDGVPIGGDNLDRAIMSGRLLKHFGREIKIGMKKLPMPSWIFSQISDWQKIASIDRRAVMAVIREARGGGRGVKELDALECLITKNYGFSLFQEIERAKCRLSSDLQTILSVNYEEILFEEEISRSQFEEAIKEEQRAIEKCIDRALNSAGLRPEEIDVVLRNGGSSLIPCFIEMLKAKFGSEKLRTQDLLTGVTAGLAIAAYGNFQYLL
ncbi:MAG: Hsp70 family protein [Candidatus Tectomicrobia bacterium]|nr:Hsp70 family protein [Candidatus Tectomicrobia bacterium]